MIGQDVNKKIKCQGNDMKGEVKGESYNGYERESKDDVKRMK